MSPPKKKISLYYSFWRNLSILRHTYFWPIFRGNWLGLISRLLFSMSYQNISNRFHPLRKLALLCNMILEGISIFTTNLPSLSLSAKLNISSASSGSTGVGRSCNYCTKIDYIITVGVILLRLFDPSYSFGDFHACLCQK